MGAMSRSAFLRSSLAALACAWASVGFAAVSNSDCLECHEKTGDRKPSDKDTGADIEVIRTAAFVRSVHGKLQCVDCHTTVKDVQHEDKLPPVNCAACHAGEAKAYATSIHGMSNAMGKSSAATCLSCHGNAHETVPVRHADSPVFKLNLPQTCAACHSNAKLTEEYRIANAHAASNYLDSIHGKALLKMGLIVAPSCNNCHGVHDIKRSVDRSSRTNHANIAATCGECHVGIQARPRATRCAASATRTTWPTTARLTTARRWPSAARTSPPTSPPATTATVPTTCSR